MLKEFRKKGVGKSAAVKVFAMFPGKWEIKEMKQNIGSQSFWRKTINDYTNGKYSEVVLNNKSWKGPVQMFDNSR